MANMVRGHPYLEVGLDHLLDVKLHDATARQWLMGELSKEARYRGLAYRNEYDLHHFENVSIRMGDGNVVVEADLVENESENGHL